MNEETYILTSEEAELLAHGLNNIISNCDYHSASDRVTEEKCKKLLAYFKSKDKTTKVN